jgi:hypothetical protein
MQVFDNLEKGRQQFRERIQGIYAPKESLEKGGEGSRGGKVIGHTKSGKAVYQKHFADHKNYSDFSHKEHSEAAAIHQLAGLKSESNDDKLHHYEACKDHEEQSDKIQGEEFWGKSQEDDSKVEKSQPSTPLEFQQLQKGRIAGIYKAGETLSEEELEESATNFLEKGGKSAVIGEIRTFGGRQYIKTSEGWKFHGKGGGAKAQSHVASSLGHHVAKVTGDDVDAAYAAASEGRKSPEEVGKVHDAFNKQKSTEDLQKQLKQLQQKPLHQQDKEKIKQIKSQIEGSSKKDDGASGKVKINSAYGDMLFSNIKSASNPTGKLTKPENYSVVELHNGQFLRTTNERANIFVKQGEGNLVGKFDPNQNFSHREDYQDDKATQKHIQAMSEGATEEEADQIARGKRNIDDHSGVQKAGILGLTKNGHAVYENNKKADHRVYDHFTIEDHQDAQKLHEEKSKEYQAQIPESAFKTNGMAGYAKNPIITKRDAHDQRAVEHGFRISDLKKKDS